MTQSFRFYGEFEADEGLAGVHRALASCSWRVELCRSGFDHTDYLRIAPRQDEIDFEMASGQSGSFLFSGGVDGTLERALALVGDFSRCLSEGGFVHRIELYEEESGDLAGYLHHLWPQGG